MMKKRNYQRRHLRAPFKESVLFADSGHVLKVLALNISEGGLLIDQIPAFPERESVSLMLSIPQIPALKNFTLLKMQTFSKDLFPRHVIRLKAKMVRWEKLSQNLDNIFRSRFGLQYTDIASHDQKYIEEYVTTFASNIIYLQTLIDSFNSDEEARLRTRVLAGILGYRETDVERIASLRSLVNHDYQSLHWL